MFMMFKGFSRVVKRLFASDSASESDSGSISSIMFSKDINGRCSLRINSLPRNFVGAYVFGAMSSISSLWMLC